MKVVIVGGGIMGLSAAWALARRGHTPVVLEQGALPNPMASSVDQHRLIRYTYGALHGYAAMVGEAYAAWDRLWPDLGRRHAVDTGQLLIGPADDPWLVGSCRSLAMLGLPYQTVDERLATRFPMLATERLGHAVWTPSGGVLLAERIVADLARWLAEHDHPPRPHHRVVAIDPARAAVRVEGGDTVEGDAVLVTAGPWVGRLVPGVAERAVPSRQIVAYVEPPAELAEAWRQGPMITDVLTGETSVFYAVPPVAGTGLKFGDHRFSRAGDPDAPRTAEPEEAAAVLRLAGRRLAAIERYRLTEARVCFYDVSPDERFVAERVGQALALAGFSGHGFKFGAVIGERTAGLLTDGGDLPAFQRWLAGGVVG